MTTHALCCVLSSLLKRKPEVSLCAGTNSRKALVILAASLVMLATGTTFGQTPVSINTGSTLGTFTTGDLQLELDASGGDGSHYTWTLIGGSLPPGMALRTDLAPFFSHNASAGLIGVATTPGTYNFALSVSSAGQVANRAFTMKIASLQVLDNYQQAPDAFVNVPYSYKYTALNNAGPVTWSIQSGLPPGLSLSSDGTLSGTPTQSGFYNLNMQLTDGTDTIFVGRAVAVFDVQITTPGMLPNATQGAAYNATIATSGGTPPYKFTTSGLPGGNLVLDPVTGNITGNIPFGPGVYGYFSVTATDSIGRSYSKQMAIAVVGIPAQLPGINGPGPTGSFDDCALGTDCYNGVGASAGTAPFTWTATGLPSGLILRYGDAFNINPATAQIAGRPTQLGTFNVKVTVTDATGATATNTFPLHVSEIFQDYNDRFPGGTVGVPYSFKTRVIGGNPPYTLSADQVNLPNGITFAGSNFLLSGTANEADAGNGAYDLHLKFADAGNAHTFNSENYFNFGYPANGTQTLNIGTGGNLGTIGVDQNYNNQLNACCAPSLAWTLSSGTLPPGITLSGSGLLSGVPTVVGTYNFVVQVTDTNNTANFALRYFTVIVSPIQDTTSYPQPTGNVNSAYSFTFAASGGTGSLTWALCQGSYLPPGLTVTSGGTLNGTAAASGQYQGCLNVSDQAGHATPIYFDVSIYPAGVNPPLDLPFGPDLGNFPWGELYLELHATGGTPPYHYSLTPGANVIPGMRVQDGQPLPLFFSAGTTAGFVGLITATGTYSTSIRVTDATGNTFDRPIHFNVTDLQVLLGQNPPNATVNVPYSFTLNGIGGSGNYSFNTNGGLPPGLSVQPSGVISGTPTTAGTYNANFFVTDPSNSSRTFFGFQMVVDAFAIGTQGVLPAGTVGVPYNQQFSAPGCGSGCSWSITNGGLPGNVSLSSGGLLSGTPSFSGNFTFTVQASGSNGTVLKRFSWQVVTSPPQPLFINMASDFGVIPFAVQWIFQLNAQGGTAPYTWSITSGSLPPGMSLYPAAEAIGGETAFFANPGHAIIAGPSRQLGQFSFTLQVTDANNNTSSQAFTVEVSPMRIEFQYNNLPISGNPLVYNQTYNQPLLVVGGDGNYTWTVVDPLPSGLGLTSAGVVNGAPTVTGQYFPQVRVTDGHSNYFQQGIGLNISSGTAATLSFNSGPNLGVFQQGFQPNISLNPTGGVGPYTLNLLSSLPPGLVLLTNLSQPASGTPASNFLLTGSPMAAGTFSFTVQIQDTQGNVGARTFFVTIAPFTLFNNTNLADGSVGVPYSVPLVAFDNSGSPVWAVAPGSTLPPGLTLSTSGLISGTPTQAGQFGFRVTAIDAGITGTYTFNVHISSLAITDAEALPDGQVGVPYTYSFAAAGTAGVTWSATGLPSGLQISSSGVISGTPQSVVRASVFITASTSTDHVQEHFVLYVTEPNPTELTLPAASLPDAVVGQSYQNALAPSGGTPPYTFTLATGSTLPPGLALYSGSQLQSIQDTRVPAVTVLAGVPAVSGLYNFGLVLTDAAGRQTTGTFTLNVSALNILPTTLGNGTSNTFVSLQFTVVGGTAPYTFTAAPVGLFNLAGAPGLTISSSGLLSGMTADTGSYTFVLHVQDANGLTFSRTYSSSTTNQKGLLMFAGPLADDWVGGGEASQFSTNGNSIYTWSVVSGTVPPGTQVQEDPNDFGPNGWGLTGAPTTPGTYTFRVRATDNADSTNFAEQTLTLRVSPFQRVAPPIGEVANAGVNTPMPIGVVGSPYSFSFKFAGGTPPYTVSESPFFPLPAGLSLSSDGTLTGVPQTSGQFTLVPVATDANGFTQIQDLFGAPILITPAGASAPLVSGFYPNVTLDDASIGAPYHSNLDYLFAWHRAFATQTWSVAQGSNLPPGMALMLGSNKTPTYLGGVPAAAGSYNFQLTATDPSGPTLTFNCSLVVNVLALTPDSLPPAFVGSSYSALFSFSGGTPPYKLTLAPYSDMPPGLSFNSLGVLSGIPTNSGEFFLSLILSDANGNSLLKILNLNVDNSAIGDAPAITLGPKPIQVLYTLGSPSPVVLPLSVSSTSGAYPFTVAESGLPSAGLSANSGTTPASVNLSIDTSGLTQGTYSGLLGVAAPQTVNQYDTTPIILTVVAPVPCTFVLTPSSYSTGSGATTSTLSISTGASCSYTATVSDQTWISISTGCPLGHVCGSYSSSGSKTISFKLAANTGATQRTGTISVNGQLFTITQFASTGCSFGINPANLQVSTIGGMASVNVTTSNSSCSWTASGLGATPSSGTGNGSVTLTIPPNNTNATQVLAATIAGQTFTATESGANCTVSLGSSDASWPTNGGAGSVTVNTPAGCSYSTVTGPSWITVTSGGTGTGPGTLLYTVDPNSTTQSRTGALTIGGQPFQISEVGAACSISIDTSRLGSPFGVGGGIGTIGITTNGSGCAWSAQDSDSWVTLIPSSGTGNGSIGVTIGSNGASVSPRSSSININGQTVTLTESGVSCGYSLQSVNGGVPAGGGTGTVGVIAPSACGWTASSNTPSWLSISSSGTAGTADVQFVAQANSAQASRIGTLTIAGIAYTVSQPGAPCSYSLAVGNTTVASAGVSSASFNFSTASTGCSPQPVSYSNWITVDNTSFAGSSGSVSFTVAPNPSGANRQGTIQVGDQGYTVTELAAQCAFSLNSYGATFNKNGASSDVLGSPNALGCSPTTGTDQPSFVNLGPLSNPQVDIFDQPFMVLPYSAVTPDLRFAQITFGGQIFYIKQTSW